MEKTWASKLMSFWVIKGKDGIWTRAWRRSTCRISSPVPYQTGPPFQDAEKGIWTLTPEGAHAPEACVSAVPPPPHSSIILFLTEMPRKNSILSIECMEIAERGWDKSPASQLSLDCRARRSGWVGSTTLILSAFTALLNCAEVGRRNRILTNDRFLSHSLLSFTYS